MVIDYKATISYINLLKEDLAIFRIKPNESQVPDFKAGQYLTLGIFIPDEKKWTDGHIPLYHHHSKKNILN